jgi:hypothetical protein
MCATYSEITLAAHLRPYHWVAGLAAKAGTECTDRMEMEKDGRPSGDGKPSTDDWRELARQIQQETDPNMMIELVQEPIAKFDEEQLRRDLSSRREIRNPSGSGRLSSVAVWPAQCFSADPKLS